MMQLQKVEFFNCYEKLKKGPLSRFYLEKVIY